jgi:protocatechuate 3,4-dioxygenase beta subunit
MRTAVLLCLVVFPLSGLLLPAGGSAEWMDRFACEPTPRDMLGPYYEPDAPVREQVGEGYLLEGLVKSAADCSPIEGARIEFWQAGPDGVYHDAYRATVIADEAGRYRFETDVPAGYGFRPPHIHVRISAQGFGTLVTQHYPQPGADSASFDLVLIPDG